MTTYSVKKLFNPVALTTSPTTYYTVPASTKTMVKQIVLVNTSAAQATASVYFVPSGGSAGNSNLIVPAVTVAPNQMQIVDLGQALSTGDFISASASAGTSITIHASGFEVV